MYFFHVLSWYALQGAHHPLLFFHRLPLLPTLLPFVHKHRFLGFIFSFFFFQNIHRNLCLCASFLIFSFLLAIYPLRLVPMCFSLGTHCGGRRCALPPAPPDPLLFLNRFPLLPTIPFFLHKHHRLFGLISCLLISIEACAYVLLSWSSRSYLQYIHWDLCLCASLLVRIAGGGAAPSPLHPPHPLLFLNRFPLLPTIPFFLHKHHRLFGLISSLLISIETSAYVLLSRYALRWRRCALPPAPPHPLVFLNRLPLLPAIPLFFHKHHPLFGLISSLLISIKTCAYVLLSWYALRGEALRPPPCTPPPAFIFKPVPLATYSVSFFS